MFITKLFPLFFPFKNYATNLLHFNDLSINKISTMQKQIKGAVTIAVTVGVPWIVGVMTFEPIALIGQWLFIILTGLQVF